MSFKRKAFGEFFMSSEKNELYVKRNFMHRENFCDIIFYIFDK